MSSIFEWTTPPIPYRVLPIFFIIDKSGSMHGDNSAGINNAMKNVLPAIAEISHNNLETKIHVAVLEFSTTAEWMHDGLIEANDFIWKEIKAGGSTSLGAACVELASKLTRKTFMSYDYGYKTPPIIVLLTDGEPADDFEEGLRSLQNNNWFKHSTKIAISIGNDTDMNVLEKFTDNIEAVVKVHNIDALKAMIHTITITSLQIGCRIGAGNHLNNQQQLIEEIEDAVKYTYGAESAVTPTDSHDDWF